MRNLCCIFNVAPHYRAQIYQMIDNELNADFYIGDSAEKLKLMDYHSLLGYKATIKNVKLFGPFYWQNNVLRLLRKPEYQVYLMTGEFFCLSTWFFLIIKALFHKNKRIYFWTHGWYGHEGWVKRKLKKIFFEISDGIFLYGNYAKNQMAQNGFDTNKLFVIHNSLSYTQQLELRENIKHLNIYKEHFNNNNKTIIFIGRLTKIKRLDLLIEAIALLKKQKEYYNLILVGDGVMRSTLEELTITKGLNDSVWFYGACYDDQVNAELIYNADLCVSPGNVGLTAIHTLMFGCPVITHNNFKRQMPEFEAIHPGSTGDFFEYDNFKSLAKSISNWFVAKHMQREAVRQACYNEIDTQWTPQFQLEVIKKGLKT